MLVAADFHKLMLWTGFVKSKKHNMSKITKKYRFEGGGDLTQNDREAIAESLQEKLLGETEKRVVLHRNTRLTIYRFKKIYKVGKAVNNGATYYFSSYFSEK